jgi:hypothetical protein
MEKKRAESKQLEAEERRMKEMDFSFQQVNDYPLSDKTLVVNPQAIPLTVDDLPATDITDI